MFVHFILFYRKGPLNFVCSNYLKSTYKKHLNDKKNILFIIYNIVFVGKFKCVILFMFKDIFVLCMFYLKFSKQVSNINLNILETKRKTKWPLILN